jgi:hypothetical protein
MGTMTNRTPTKRRNKNVMGSECGIPKRAMMKPELQISTKMAGIR